MSRVSIPAHILTYNLISERSRLIWMHMYMASSSNDTSSEVHETWAPQKNLAAALACSKSSIARSMKQLREHGLIVDTKRRHSRFRIYELRETPVYTEIPVKKAMPPKQAEPAQSMEQKAREQTAGWMLNFGEQWKKKYIFVDGRYGRPTIEQIVYEAILTPDWAQKAPSLADWIHQLLETYNAMNPFVMVRRPYKPPHERRAY